MALKLTIENHASLPDGGPLSITVTGTRGIDIGRDQYLDWTLPDPSRAISGKHCEVRYLDGGYWLRDVSRNGTFLNRNPQRVQEAHPLRNGDRIEIGHYVIGVRIDQDSAAAPAAEARAAPAAPGEYWTSSSDAAPPISPNDLRPARELKPVRPDFSEWAVDVPASGTAPRDAASTPPRPTPPLDDDLWARGPQAPEPPSPPPIPAPRRPAAVPPAGQDPWSAGPAQPTWQDASPEDVAPPLSWDMPPVPDAAPPGSDAIETWGTPSFTRPAQDPDAPAKSVAAVPGPQAAPVTNPPQAAAPPSDLSASTAAVAASADATAIMRRFARGAGVPVETLAWRDPGDLAEELGALVRLSTESLKQLLAARAETKRVARAGSQTTIQALDNNPLKFSPTIDDALRIMLGRPSGGYLDARRAVEQGFRDLKTHQVKTYSAMQHALRLLLAELDPDAIAHSAGDDRGLGSLLGSKKAKLWDLYLTRWDTLGAPHEEGILDAFMVFFSECYDRGEKGR